MFAMTAQTLQRQRNKGRAYAGGFYRLPHAVMDADSYRTLSARAVKLLNDIGRQFLGKNNGDLSAAWGVMRRRGWKSRDTLTKAQVELLAHGLIEKTRQGGLHMCSLYALTWLPIDACGGKLDVAATRVASGLWKHPMTPDKNAPPNTDSRHLKHGIRAYGQQAA
jgi:hypothetical protein